MSLSPHLLFPFNLPNSIDQLDEYVRNHEAAFQLKKDNEARIYWNTNTIEKTRLSIVYIHGFSSSPGEGNPFHIDLAKQLNANLFVQRLHAHGYEKDALKTANHEHWIRNVVQAIQIGEMIGEKVVLIGTSTGGILTMMLQPYFKSIFKLLVYSPLVQFKDWRLRKIKSSFFDPLSASFFSKVNMKSEGGSFFEDQFWYQNYPLSSVIELQKLVELFQREIRIRYPNCRTLISYYHKDDNNTDHRIHIQSVLNLSEFFLEKNMDLSLKKYEKAHHILTNPIHNAEYKQVFEDAIHFINQN